MKVSDYIIQRIADEGIKEVFQVYGAASGDLVDSFTRINGIRYICAQHEQGAGFMAEGYAKVSGNFGVAIATSGPGGQNFVTPIANCFYDSVPCLFITGQVKTEFMRKDKSIRQIGFQESPTVEIVKPITKYAITVLNPEDIRYELDKALYLMKNGRPGPVLLDLPIDIQKADVDPDKIVGFIPEKMFPTYKNYGNNVLNALMRDIQKSKRPCFLIGGGSKKSENNIHKIAQLLGIPCLRTWNAKDIITNDFSHFSGDIGTYGGLGRSLTVQNCDLLICLGTRISGRITGGNPKSFAREAKKWMIDVDPSTKRACIEQGVEIDQFVISDLNEFCKDFLEYAVHVDISTLPNFKKWLNQTFYWRDNYDPVDLHKDAKCDGVNPYLFMRELSEQCGSNDIIVSDCGGNQVIFAHAFKTKTGQTCFTSNGNSPMGFSMCGAIGAWFSRKDKNASIVCIIGDGGMQMNIQELQTIKNYGVNIKIFIINNGIYGITKAFQKVNFEGRAEACESPHYTVPKFVDIGRAYGIQSHEVDSFDNTQFADGVHEIISKCLKSSNPEIININCPDWHSYYPKISGWKTPIEDSEPYLPRNEFRSNLLIDPMSGWETHEY